MLSQALRPIPNMQTEAEVDSEPAVTVPEEDKWGSLSIKTHKATTPRVSTQVPTVHIHIFTHAHTF